MLIAFLISLLILVLGIWWFLNRPVFGKLPSGERLERIKASPNYKNGSFQNLSPTPQLAEGYTMWKVFIRFIFNKPRGTTPNKPIKTIKTDLHSLDKKIDQLVWLGHSSYYFTLNGQSYLVDPVLSKYASPVMGSNKAFKHTYEYKVSDLPAIDFLLITHDHFDHLDYETILGIKTKVKKVICGLGVGEHFEYWGYDLSKITELDWYEVAHFDHSINIAATPVRHFSGRSLKKNSSLFCSYVLQSGDKTLFIGGDSGYDAHLKLIGDLYGPFDLAILENGQYNEAWPYIHAMPTETAQIIKDINAKAILPVHTGKFALAMHHWAEPLDHVANLGLEDVRILTPPIGAVINLDDHSQHFNSWWK